MAKHNLVSLLTVILVARSCLGDLVFTPLNTVAHAGDDTVVLRCEAAATPPARVMWTEFSSNSEVGAVISDNRLIISSHPNAARYAILGTGVTFDLQISNVSLSDGGRYLCQDINSAPPSVFRGSADLIVLASDPVCTEFHTITGSITEGQYYTTECEVDFKADVFHPNMSWTGPGSYEVHDSVSETTVWTISSFYAQRDQEGGQFVCTTRFLVPPEFPEFGATNIPTYQYVYTGIGLVINWPPQSMYAEPIKMIYDVGDEITCYADSKPVSTYRWTNMRTQVMNPVGAVFTVTEDLQGLEQVLRCNAVVLLDGSLYTNNLFINVTVREPTTLSPSTSTTTPPSADGPCNDLTGHWSSTNPNSHICIEMDSKGNLLVLIRNGSDTYFVPGNGKTQYGDYKHVGFTGVWPVGQGGVGGFTGECHNCYGNEVILLSGLSRNKAEAPGCGESAGTHLTPQYVLTRYGPPCRDINETVYRPSPAHIKYMGIKPEKIIR